MLECTEVVQIGDWVAEHIANTNEFMSRWLELHHRDPERFPASLKAQDWAELVEAFEVRDGEMTGTASQD